jgi:5'-nucleotidase
MTKERKTLLIDMDCTLVEMLPVWLSKYNEITGEKIKEEDIIEWGLSKYVLRPEVLDSLLEQPDFFVDMEPIVDSVHYLTRLMSAHDVVILTQPPRKAHHAIEGKRLWMKRYFPFFDTGNMVFAHRKSLVRGDYLFDDCPAHLHTWKAANPQGQTVTIDYKRNDFATVDHRFPKAEAWRKFYELVSKDSAGK